MGYWKWRGIAFEGRSLMEQSPHSRPPDQSSPPWKGVVFIAFDDRPFAKSLLNSYTFYGLPGYCGFIALATSLQWPWLGWWLDLWRPVVRFMRSFIPVFDNSSAMLVAKGFEYRVDVIHHLLAVCWLAAIIVFVYLTWTVLRLTHDEWCRLVRIVPRHHLLRLAGGAFFFGVALYWAVVGFGFGSETPLAAFHRYDALLIVIGLIFGALILFGIGFQVSLGALIVSSRIERQFSDRTDSPDCTL